MHACMTYTHTHTDIHLQPVYKVKDTSESKVFRMHTLVSHIMQCIASVLATYTN